MSVNSTGLAPRVASAVHHMRRRGERSGRGYEHHLSVLPCGRWQAARLLASRLFTASCSQPCDQLQVGLYKGASAAGEACGGREVAADQGAGASAGATGFEV